VSRKYVVFISYFLSYETIPDMIAIIQSIRYDGSARAARKKSDLRLFPPQATRRYDDTWRSFSQ
jgi:hypothetical protein